jgi:hypothetical protein
VKPKPGGRGGVSDIVAEDHLTPGDRAERGSCESSGALTRRAPLTPSACHRSHQFSEVPFLLVEEGGVARLHPES